MKPLTPSQTIGPFFHRGLEWAVTGSSATRRDDEALVDGRLLDGAGEPVTDAVVEIWQPGTTVSGDDTVVAGFQRVYTDAGGRFTFLVSGSGPSANVAHVTLFSRGLNGALRTRAYIGAAPDDLASRPELGGVPPARLATLVPSCSDAAARRYSWTIRLQGDLETVFFDFLRDGD